MPVPPGSRILRLLLWFSALLCPGRAFWTQPIVRHRLLSELKVSVPLGDYGTTDSRDMPVSKESPITPGSAAFPKVGILLLNLGGPETLDDVEGTSG